MAKRYEDFNDYQLQALADKGDKRAELVLQKRRERINTAIPVAIMSIIASIEHEIESWIGFHPYGADYVTYDSPYAENYYKYNILEFTARINDIQEDYESRRNAIENPDEEEEDSELYEEEDEEEDSELTQEERLALLQEREDEEIQAIQDEQDEEERDISTARAESNEFAAEAILKLQEQEYESALVLLDEAIYAAPEQEWHTYPDLPFEVIRLRLRDWIEENVIEDD